MDQVPVRIEWVLLKFFFFSLLRIRFCSLIDREGLVSRPPPLVEVRKYVFCPVGFFCTCWVLVVGWVFGTYRHKLFAREGFSLGVW